MMPWPWLHSGASLLLCTTAELWWCFWGACPQTNSLPAGTCRHIWFKTLVRRGGCACLVPWSRLARQDRRHCITTQMVAAASHPGMGTEKELQARASANVQSSPCPDPLNLCSQETPPTPHFLLMNRGIKIFELQHQQLINV